MNIGGDFSTWDDTYTLALGNEHTIDRPWVGEMYLVAIYNKSYTPDTLPNPLAVESQEKLTTTWGRMKT